MNNLSGRQVFIAVRELQTHEIHMNQPCMYLGCQNVYALPEVAPRGKYTVYGSQCQQSKTEIQNGNHL